jgi:hypothetical protein
MLSKMRIAVVAAIAVAELAAGCKDKTNADVPQVTGSLSAATKPSAPPAPAAALEVTSLDLAKDYKSDDISDDKYRNRSLRVRGEVGRAGKDILDQDDPVTVILTTLSGDVQANFVDAGKVKSLKSGQKVALRCTGKGAQLDTPILGDCTLE